MSMNLLKELLASFSLITEDQSVWASLCFNFITFCGASFWALLDDLIWIKSKKLGNFKKIGKWSVMSEIGETGARIFFLQSVCQWRHYLVPN